MSKIEDLKINNEMMIRECFYDGAIWTKNELSDKTNISLAATTNILVQLQKHQEIIYKGEAASTGGRKSKQYQLNKDYYHILKVALKCDDNQYLFLLQRVDLFNHILEEKIIPSKQGTLSELEEALEMMLQNGLVEVISISIPGVCQNGKMDIGDFKNLIGFDLRELIQAKFKIAVIIENDVNVACIGFSYDYPEYHHLAFVYQPKIRYIGCGIMIDKKLYNGFSHFAGELSYAPLYSFDKQEVLLKEAPKKLLEEQVQLLCSVINPELIGVHSDRYELLKLDLNRIPITHQPRIECVEDFDEVLMNGLYQIALKKLKERRGKK